MDPAARRGLPRNRGSRVDMNPSSGDSSGAHQAVAGNTVDKFVIAAEAPWTGELYRTRAGKPRFRFRSVETFCCAFLTATKWELDTSAATAATTTAPRSSRAPYIRAHADSPTKQKFIVSTTAPWNGEIYWTQPGLMHVAFATFEEFLVAVLAITRWPLNWDQELAASPVSRRRGSNH